MFLFLREVDCGNLGSARPVPLRGRGLLARVALAMLGSLFALCWLNGPLLGQNPSDAAPVLTEVRAIRALTPEQAAQSRPVRLRGVVTVLSGWRSSFFFEDATGGISVDRASDLPALEPGLEVEIEGVTAPGKFAPMVQENAVRILGPGKLSPARVFSAAELAGGAEDSQWLAIRGVVRSAHIEPEWGRQVLLLDVDIGGGDPVAVWVHDYADADWRQLPGATVTVRGACGTVFNDKRQFAGVRLFAASLGSVQVEKAAPKDPFDLPVQPLDSLLRFDGPRIARPAPLAANQPGAVDRVRVDGIVTYVEPGRGLYIQNSNLNASPSASPAGSRAAESGVYVDSRQNTPVAIGSPVAVAGYPALGRYGPQLDNAVFRVLGPPRPVAPAVEPASAMIAEQDGFRSAPFNATLVQLTGRVLDDVWRAGEEVILLRDGDTLFTARLAIPQPLPGRERLLARGSLIRATGVCAAAGQTREAQSFELLLRSPADLAQLEPGPWWTREHAAWAVAALIAGFLGFLVWQARSRRQEAIARALWKQRQERDTLLASIVEFSDDAILAKRLDGTILSWNRGAERIFGWTSDEMVGQSILRLIPPELHSEEDCIVAQLAKGESVHHFETRRLHKDGTGIDVSLTVSPIRDAAGKVVGASKTLRDITERKRTEAALKASEERHSLVLQGLSVGIFDWDLALQQMRTSPQLEQLMQTYPGRPLSREEVEDMVHPEDRELRRQRFQAHLERRGPYDVEVRMRRGDGVYRWFHITGQASWDENGKPVRMVGSLNDVTAQREAKAALQASEERYALALRGLSVGVWDWNPDTNEQLWSPKYLEILGIADGGYAPRFDEFTERLHPEDRNRVFRALADHLAGQSRYDVEYRLQRQDRSYVWIHATGQAIWDAAGKPLRMVGSVDDITERKRAEAALKDSEERFALALQGMSVGVWDWDVVTGRQEWSERMRQMIGVGDDFSPEYVASQSYVHPEDLGRVTAAIEAHLKERKRYDIEFRFLHPEGRAVWVRSTGQAIWDADGKPLRMVGSIDDITERKRAEAALKVSEERYALAVSGLSVGLWDWNIQFNEKYWSPQFRQMLGLEDGDPAPLLEGFAAMLHPEDRDRTMAALSHHLDREGPYEVEYRLRRKDETYIWIHATGQAIWDAQGRPLRMVGSVNDISDRKRAEAALKASEERYALALQGLSVGLWDWNVATGDLYWSPRFKQIVGLTEEDFVPRYVEFSSRLHPEDKERTEAMLFGHALNKTPYDVEYRLRRVDGTYVWIRATGQATWDAQGKPLRMVGSVDDITPRKAAEEALRRSEQRYALALTALSVGVWEWDVPTGEVRWSPMFRKIAGITDERSLPSYTEFVNRLHSEDRDRTEAALRAHLYQRAAYDIEYRLRRDDGAWVWIRATGQATWDAEGKPLVMVGSLDDITARKTAEAARKESEERYAVAVESLSVGLWDWNVKTGALYWSPLLKRQLGLDETSFEPDFQGLDPWIHPQDRAGMYASLQDHLERRAPYDLEIRMIRADGVPIWVQATGQAIWDSEGQPLRMVGSVADITRRKDAEEKFRLVVESAPVAIVAVDESGAISVVNRQTERMFGWAGAELLGKPIETLIPERYRGHHPALRGGFFGAPGDADPGQKPAQPPVQRPMGAGRDLYALRKDGTEFPVEIGLTPIQTERGTIVLAVAVDITLRRELEDKTRELNRILEERVLERTAQLEAANRELDAFAYAASHDLKAPLRVIYNASVWLEEDLEPHLTAETRENMDLLRGRVRRMDRLLDDLLEYSRIGRKTDDRYAEQIGGAELIENILGLLAIPEGFTVDPHSGFAEILVHRMPLQQILLNLISNAIKHHDKKTGHIQVSVEAADDHFTFCVQDDGPGIPAQFHEQIFHMFQTLKPRDQVEGSGMGLAMVRKHIEIAGGTLRLESEVGQGSRFLFTWPRKVRVETPVEAAV